MLIGCSFLISQVRVVIARSPDTDSVAAPVVVAEFFQHLVPIGPPGRINFSVDVAQQLEGDAAAGSQQPAGNPSRDSAHARIVQYAVNQCAPPEVPAVFREQYLAVSAKLQLAAQALQSVRGHFRRVNSKAFEKPGGTIL